MSLLINRPASSLFVLRSNGEVRERVRVKVYVREREPHRLLEKTKRYLYSSHLFRLYYFLSLVKFICKRELLRSGNNYKIADNFALCGHFKRVHNRTKNLAHFSLFTGHASERFGSAGCVPRDR